MKIKKKKFEAGEAAQYMTRRSALKKLQLSLKDFRKVCILKGIYPREPKNRKKAQKGATGVQTLYNKKDIQFLLHEPIIWKMREKNTFHKKVGKYRTLKEKSMVRRMLNKQPTLKLDHIVKERYPTFIDALQDLDDCLTLCFLFSTFPSLAHVPREHSIMCRRLTTEFMHAVIEAKALRKVFVSIKGYYFQAEVKGVTINWIQPHHFSFQPHSKNDVDFKIMSTFVQFYTVMLGFINFRLFHELNLFYPPKFSSISTSDVDNNLVDEGAFVSERVAALNVPLLRTKREDEDVPNEVDDFHADDSSEEAAQRAKEQAEVESLKTLFKGLKFFLNREVPREPLVFVIRCLGGEVSWDKLSFVGSTFDETDESITHQITDRPHLEKKFISRYYIQPQWVFDCVNFRKLLPVEKYFAGVVLPPHLSPFVDDSRPRYKPAEELMLKHPELAEEQRKRAEFKKEVASKLVGDDVQKNKAKTQKKKIDEEPVEVDEDDGLTPKERMLRKMKVTAGESHVEVPWQNKMIDREEYKLREKMIKNKHRKLYKSMMEGRTRRAKESWLLNKKKKRIVEKKENAPEKA